MVDRKVVINRIRDLIRANKLDLLHFDTRQREIEELIERFLADVDAEGRT